MAFFLVLECRARSGDHADTQPDHHHPAGHVGELVECLAGAGLLPGLVPLHAAQPLQLLDVPASAQPDHQHRLVLPGHHQRPAGHVGEPVESWPALARCSAVDRLAGLIPWPSSWCLPVAVAVAVGWLFCVETGCFQRVGTIPRAIPRTFPHFDGDSFYQSNQWVTTRFRTIPQFPGVFENKGAERVRKTASSGTLTKRQMHQNSAIKLDPMAATAPPSPITSASWSSTWPAPARCSAVDRLAVAFFLVLTRCRWRTGQP